MADATNLVTNPAGRAVSGTVVVRENLATNPSAESDNGWRVNAGATHSATWDVSVSHSGTRSRRVEVIASSTDSLSLYAVGTNNNRTSVAGEQPYTFSVYLRAGQAGYRGFVSILWYDSANAILGVTEGVLQDTPEGQWIRCSVSGVAPAGAVSCYPSAFIRKATGNAAIGNFGHADDALFEETSVLSPYFDGSYSPDPDLAPVWTGTPDASSSQLVGQAPVGWVDAYYSPTRDRVAALPGGATFTLLADPGASTLVVETETDTLHSPHTGTVVTVTEPYFRAAVIEGTYDGPYFDGDTPDVRGDDGFGWVHAWDGAPDASTSTRTYGPFPGIALELVSDPVPSVGVTVTGLDAEAPSTLTVERTIPGEGWVQVPGMVGVSVTGGMYDVDYTAPLQVPVTYRVTVDGAVQPENLQAVITVPSDVCWLQDPVNPYTAVSVSTIIGYDGAPYFAADSFTRLMRELPGTVQQVVGSGAPVGMGGTRQAPTVPIHVVTRALADSNRLRTLLTTAYPLMLRTIPPVRHLGPTVFLHASLEERPMWEAAPHDGSREDWVLDAQVVRSPRFRVLVPRWTYGDVAALWETYGQAVAEKGGTYLDWVRDPSPGVGVLSDASTV